MSKSIREKAHDSAQRCLPLGIVNRTDRYDAYVSGYMAGHAAHTRSSSKRLQPFISKAIEELRIVEREIGVPSQALKLLESFQPGREA